MGGNNMMTDKMAKALNEQINEELFSAYLYLAMSAWFESQNLPGFAFWMKVQAREENTHAMKFFDFLHERRGRVLLKAVKEPGKEWKSPLAAFEAALEHEQYITGRINDLVNLATTGKDHATAGFLQWFVKEQVEEEASADRIVQMLKMAANAPGALLMLDHQMGERK
jgi:ferritin